MKLRTRAVGAFLLAACAGCASGNIRDAYVAGWQSQRDVYIHQFVHANFARERAWAVQSEKLEKSESVDWPDYARPLLAAATRARALSEDRGRALDLERFLAHMRSTPTAQATVDWFAGDAADIRNAANDSVERTKELLGRLAGPAQLTEDLFQRIASSAAAEGVVRGRALQHANLRRTAGLYFRARDDQVVLPGDAGPDGAGLRDGGDETAATGGIGARRDLIGEVDRLLDSADLRAAILRPRACHRTDEVVTCVPQSTGAEVPEGDGTGATSPADALTPPADNANEVWPNMPRREFFEEGSGW